MSHYVHPPRVTRKKRVMIFLKGMMDWTRIWQATLFLAVVLLFVAALTYLFFIMASINTNTSS